MHFLLGVGVSHLDMEFSEVRSLGDRIVLKFLLGCDTAGHKQTQQTKTTNTKTKICQ